MTPCLRFMLLCLSMLHLEAGLAADPADIVALKPPMGWNSFDCYDSRINEAQFKANVDFMASELKQYGWQYMVIDYIWFNPAPGNWSSSERRYGQGNVRVDKDGRPIDRLVMDQYGRLLPAENRFPSAGDGKGFKPIADYVHDKGLKFGIHIMRGIPRQAYFDNTPIKDTQFRAKDIAEPWDECLWLNNMMGVDAIKPGAQAYYNSLFDLYAKWEVDFIKADDMMFPVYHAGEIEMMRKAIRKTGRPMVLSLSCGDAPISRAHHLKANASMWRISGDFWDKWRSLERMFELANAWSPFIGPGHWPDADMLPIGHLSLDDRPHGPDRLSRFTWEQHRMMMTLWSMMRSPLMMGGDLPSSPEKSLSFLKNSEVLYVNQNSTDNRQVLRDDVSAIWIATDPKTGDRFLALFNLVDAIREVSFDFESEMLRGRYKVRDLWKHEDIGFREGNLSIILGRHDAGMYRLTAVDD